ncbi:phosphoribosyltransferase family protein [Lacrimispora amygdalina]|uniref:phosphoribosyltransferase family protein n=1 Tax=Lacrimispora amygdalina TaxID=253257 RepID=UPI000BE4232F|nr:phosphoribosyltransferase family protein [Lacrimispora amygdalina]
MERRNNVIKVNEIVFGSEQFSNGEVSYKPVSIKQDNNVIELYFQDNKDIADLQFAVEFIRSEEPESKISLYMLYVPYGRMDRPIKGYAFSLKLFANIINRLNLDKIITLDNHSSGITDMIKNVFVQDINLYINKVTKIYEPDYLFFPDKGAMKKYPKILSQKILNTYPYFYGEKQRVLDDSREIISYELFNGELNLVGRRVLIIDDICCTGGTVIRVANIMKQRGVSDIALWVAHCENNVIKYPIVREDSPISKIYTCNSIIRNYQIPEIEFVKIVV